MLKKPIAGGDWLVERCQGHYKMVRPHSLLGYRTPAPEARQAESKVEYVKVESKTSFHLSTPQLRRRAHQLNTRSCINLLIFRLARSALLP
jgi:hypothetical protein